MVPCTNIQYYFIIYKAKSKNREDRAIDIKHINRVDPAAGASSTACKLTKLFLRYSYA